MAHCPDCGCEDLAAGVPVPDEPTCGLACRDCKSIFKYNEAAGLKN